MLALLVRFLAYHNYLSLTLFFQPLLDHAQMTILNATALRFCA